MNEQSQQLSEPNHKPGRLFARFGDGHWYAILPDMADTFRKLGAAVSTLPESGDMEHKSHTGRR